MRNGHSFAALIRFCLFDYTTLERLFDYTTLACLFDYTTLDKKFQAVNRQNLPNAVVIKTSINATTSTLHQNEIEVPRPSHKK
jgi:hypothetical protein